MDPVNLTAAPQAQPRIKRSSFSRYTVWEECPYRARLAYVDKRAEKPRPGDAEPANTRGQRFHDLARDCITAKRNDLTEEFAKQAELFEDYLIDFRRAHDENRLVAETAWYFDANWTPLTITPNQYDSANAVSTVEKLDYWLQMIIDVLTFKDQSEASVYDWKTGKREFSHYKHTLQLQLYACGVFSRFPELEKINATLLYVDEPHVAPYSFRRDQVAHMRKRWTGRLNRMLDDREFTPKPSSHNCQFCPFQTHSNKWIDGTGDCSFNLRIPRMVS